MKILVWLDMFNFLDSGVVGAIDEHHSNARYVSIITDYQGVNIHREEKS